MKSKRHVKRKLGHVILIAFAVNVVVNIALESRLRQKAKVR